MQLDLLWAYMQVDMEADRFENEMRQSPNRQKLIKNRDFIVEQQSIMKTIETDTGDKRDRMEAIKAEASRLGDLLKAQLDAFESNPPQDVDEVEKQMQGTQKLLDSLHHYEQELARMLKDAEALDQRQHEIRVRAAKAKAEYDQVKKQYDAEYKDDTAKLAQLRANAEKEAKSIDPELLERYKRIKQHSTPPMAKLAADQCGGCFMSQPAVVMREVKAGEKVVSCDNCGRILYVTE